MIVKVAEFLSSVAGSIDKDYWLRPLKGRPGYAVLCRKPQYSQKAKDAMREDERAKRFGNLMEKAKNIYRDPAQRAVWERRHIAAIQEASRHQHLTDSKGRPYVPPRLWDYIRRELAKAGMSTGINLNTDN